MVAGGAEHGWRWVHTLAHSAHAAWLDIALVKAHEAVRARNRYEIGSAGIASACLAKLGHVLFTFRTSKFILAGKGKMVANCASSFFQALQVGVTFRPRSSEKRR